MSILSSSLSTEAVKITLPFHYSAHNDNRDTFRHVSMVIWSSGRWKMGLEYPSVRSVCLQDVGRRSGWTANDNVISHVREEDRISEWHSNKKHRNESEPSDVVVGSSFLCGEITAQWTHFTHSYIYILVHETNDEILCFLWLLWWEKWQ